jgi:hypothetical protein
LRLGESLGEAPPFRTHEHRYAVGTNSFAPYWRLTDPLCAGVLGEGRNPNDFLWIRSIFPLFRTASLLKVPRSAQSLPSWQPFVFLAGWQFGKQFPNKGAFLVEGSRSRLGNPLNLLRRLDEVLGPRSANLWNLRDAFDEMIPTIGMAPRRLEQRLIRLTEQTYAAGLAASTTAKKEPDLSEFIAGIGRAIPARRTQLHIRALIHSCANAEGRPVAQRLPHPLLTVAAEQYQHVLLAREILLTFLDEQLRGFDVRSENECPADDVALVDWVEAARRYGRRLWQHDHQRVEEVTAEFGPFKIQPVREVVDCLRRWSKRMPAGDLTALILKWHRRVHRWSKSAYYGQELDRVVCCADFAIWAAWCDAARGSTEK